MKKYIYLIILSFALASCSLGTAPTRSTDIQKPLPVIPITLSGSTGATSTGFSQDLNGVIEKAFKDANK